MKKKFIFLLCLFLIVGCGTKKENRDSNYQNPDSNTSNIVEPSNSNEGSNTDSDVGKYKVNLYLFHSNSCNHCQEEIRWLKSIDGKYSYLQIHYYEVSEEEELYNKVKDALGIDSPYVPLTIIGDEYFIGFADTKERKFLRTAEEMSKRNLCDVVGTVIENGDVQACIKQNEGA